MMHSISIKLVVTSHSYSFSFVCVWYEGLRSILSTCQYNVITMQCYYHCPPVDRSSEFTNLIPENMYLSTSAYTPQPPVLSNHHSTLCFFRFDFLFRFHIRGEIIQYSSFSDLFHSAQCPPCSSKKVKSLSRVWLFMTPWTAAHQAPLSMGFSRQEYWSGLPFPSPRDLPNPGIEPGSPALQADTLPSEPPGKSRLLQIAGLPFFHGQVTFLIYVYYSLLCHSYINKHLGVSMSWLLCFSCLCILESSLCIF